MAEKRIDDEMMLTSRFEEKNKNMDGESARNDEHVVATTSKRNVGEEGNTRTWQLPFHYYFYLNCI